MEDATVDGLLFFRREEGLPPFSRPDDVEVVFPTSQFGFSFGVALMWYFVRFVALIFLLEAGE